MNDLISRQEAIDLFPNDTLEWDTYSGYIAPHFARRMIEELPSAQPVRHGKWIYGNDFHWYTASCNKCGYQRRTDIKADGWNQWKFCPNCGAKMDAKRRKKNELDSKSGART